MSRRRASVAGVLVVLATWMLPAGHRDRYRHEFAAELHDLRRRERLPYAVRVLVRAWTLNAALTAQPATIGVVTMPAKPWKCRLGRHDWQRKHNEEDRTPYTQCTRCNRIQDVRTVYAHPGGTGPMIGGGA
jgi:hypothetical protein